MLVRREPDGGVERALDVAFVGVELEELEPGLGGELCVERTLERVLGLLPVVQALGKLAEDLPFSSGLAVGQVLCLEVRDFRSPDRVYS